MTETRQDHTRNVLAIDTATDACSVAVCIEGSVREIHEVIPRQHSQRLLGMLDEILPHGSLVDAGIEAIAYGAGPGSFTGLRIAASAVQGLTFAAELPAVSVSTLACQALTAAREGLVRAGDTVLSLIDARIDQTYYGLFTIGPGLPLCVYGPGVCEPEALPAEALEAASASAPIVAVGSGARFADRFPTGFAYRTNTELVAVLPRARDMLPFAEQALEEGNLQAPEQVAPTYVQETIGWKKVAEQGKRS